MINREKVREIFRSPGKKKLQYLLVGVLLAAAAAGFLGERVLCRRRAGRRRRSNGKGKALSAD